MLKKLSAALVVLFALFISVGLMLPEQYRVERSVAVARPAATVFALLDGFQHFDQWSPWLERDPDAAYRLSGPATGPGARVSWEGDPRRVGTGWQQVTATIPGERVDLHLELEPAGSAQAYFAIDQLNPGTVVLSWGITTDMTAGHGLWGSLRGRYLGLFLERWLAPHMERGLDRFRSYAEGMPAAAFGEAEITVMTVVPQPVLYVSGRTTQAAEDVAAAIGEAFSRISAFMVMRELEAAGQPLAITRGWDENGYRFDAAIPVADPIDDPEGTVQSGLSPGGRCVRIVHRGPYGTILESYEKLAAFMAVRGLEEGPVSWEQYVSDPAETAPADLVTHVYLQLAD
jgi:effector-binding domain-containing protein